MKKLSVILCLLLVLGLFAGCGEKAPVVPAPGSDVNNTVSNIPSDSAPISSELTVSSVSLTRDEAINIALREAGVSKDAVYDLEAELERGFGKSVWEIDFESGNKEYSFDIDAVSGEVILRDIERRD